MIIMLLLPSSKPLSDETAAPIPQAGWLLAIPLGVFYAKFFMRMVYCSSSLCIQICGQYSSKNSSPLAA